MNEENLIAFLLFSILLTTATYMIVPLIFRFKKGRLPIKKARKICIINSIVVALLWAVYHFSNDMNINVAPAIIWYWINCSILKEKNTSGKIYMRQYNDLLDVTMQRDDQTESEDNSAETHAFNNVDNEKARLTIEDIKALNIPIRVSRHFLNTLDTASKLESTTDIRSCIESAAIILKKPTERDIVQTILQFPNEEIKQVVQEIYIKVK